jgi:hypothetical protein
MQSNSANCFIELGPGKPQGLLTRDNVYILGSIPIALFQTERVLKTCVVNLLCSIAS